MADKVKKAHGHIVQADWNQTDPLQMDYIHNKPEIPSTEELQKQIVIRNCTAETEQLNVQIDFYEPLDTDGTATNYFGVAFPIHIPDQFVGQDISVSIDNTALADVTVNSSNTSEYIGITNSKEEYFTNFNDPRCLASNEGSGWTTTEVTHNVQSTSAYLMLYFVTPIPAGQLDNYRYKYSDKLKLAYSIKTYTEVGDDFTYDTCLKSNQEVIYNHPISDSSITKLIESYDSNIDQSWSVIFVAGETNLFSRSTIELETYLGNTTTLELTWMGIKPTFKVGKQYQAIFKVVKDKCVGYCALIDEPINVLGLDRNNCIEKNNFDFIFDSTTNTWNDNPAGNYYGESTETYFWIGSNIGMGRSCYPKKWSLKGIEINADKNLYYQKALLQSQLPDSENKVLFEVERFSNEDGTWNDWTSNLPWPKSYNHNNAYDSVIGLTSKPDGSGLEPVLCGVAIQTDMPYAIPQRDENSDLHVLETPLTDTSAVSKKHLETFAATVLPGETIPSGANLNTYTTPGSYRSESGTISATLVNTPYTTTGFKLEVFNTTSSNQIMQEVKCNASSARTYRRIGNLSNGAWTFNSWYQVIQATNGIVPISQGGTGANTQASAAKALGICYYWTTIGNGSSITRASLGIASAGFVYDINVFPAAAYNSNTSVTIGFKLASSSTAPVFTRARIIWVSNAPITQLWTINNELTVTPTLPATFYSAGTGSGVQLITIDKTPLIAL